MHRAVKKALIWTITLVLFVLFSYGAFLFYSALQTEPEVMEQPTSGYEHTIYKSLRNNDAFYRVETEFPPREESIRLLEEAYEQAASVDERNHIQFMLFKLKLNSETGAVDEQLVTSIIDFAHNIQVSNVTRASTLALLQRKYAALVKGSEVERQHAETLQTLTFSHEKLSSLKAADSEVEMTLQFQEYIYKIYPLPDIGLFAALAYARMVSAEALLEENPDEERIGEWTNMILGYTSRAENEIQSLREYMSERSASEWTLYELGSADRLLLTLLLYQAEIFSHLAIAEVPRALDPEPYFKSAVNNPYVSSDSNRYLITTRAAAEYAEYLVNREYYFNEDRSEEIRTLTQKIIADDTILPPEHRSEIRGDIARLEFDKNERYYYEEMAKVNPEFKEYLLNEVGWESVEPLAL